MELRAGRLGRRLRPRPAGHDPDLLPADPFQLDRPRVALVVAEAVADQLESGGHYLSEHGFSDMTDDLSALIRQNPLPSLLVGFGVGFMIGMAWRR